MDSNRLEGIGHQIKGTLKESLGKIIGDAKLTADGAAERSAGHAQSASVVGPDQVGGIDTDRIMGIGHQFKGAVRQGLGNVTGDPALEQKGRAEKEAGVAQNAAGGARDEAREELLDTEEAKRQAAVKTSQEQPGTGEMNL